MRELYRFVNALIQRLRGEDCTLLRLCLLALGALFGLSLPKRIRRPVGLAAVVLLVLAYAPAISRFLNAGNREHSMFQ